MCGGKIIIRLLPLRGTHLILMFYKHSMNNRSLFLLNNEAAVKIEMERSRGSQDRTPLPNMSG